MHWCDFPSLTVSSLQRLTIEALILVPADCEVRSVMKFINAKSIALIVIHLPTDFPLLVTQNCHGAPVQKIVYQVDAKAQIQ